MANENKRIIPNALGGPIIQSALSPPAAFVERTVGGTPLVDLALRGLSGLVRPVVEATIKPVEPQPKTPNLGEVLTANMGQQFVEFDNFLVRTDAGSLTGVEITPLLPCVKGKGH